MSVLKQNGIPLYHQLREIFTEKINNGEWKSGDIIPNELMLCQQFEVSRGPIRQALDQMVRDGLLSRKQGKGTIVLPPKMESGLSGFFSFTRLIRGRGMRPGVRLLDLETTMAEGSVANSLNLPARVACYKIRRLRLANEEPLILETVYMPQHICSDLSEENIISRPLYDILCNECGIVLQQAKQFFEPTVADEYEARMLGIPEGTPVLLIQNTTYATGNLPVVFSKAIMRGDRVRYYVEISAQISGT
jgi:GntR family transcriptional regulator